jgi:DNA polymerase-4/DNA polymerase V
MNQEHKKHKAIIHIDGDAFFASCEVAVNEALRGKPIVTGQEKGMAIAVSYEAKALGVSRGMLMGEIRKLVPDIHIFPGHYDLYKVLCRRMYAIVGRYSSRVEEYSIDECFADISNEADSWEELVEIARNIQRDLEHDLGMTFSLGLGPTKTLAKVASKWKKPAGFTAIYGEPGRTMLDTIENFLKDVPIGAVWGIGRSISLHMQTLGVKTALDFVHKPYEWVREHFSKPTQELWYELQGITMHRVHTGSHEKHQSIRATRTFRPPTNNLSFLISQLSKNAEKACLKLRQNNLHAKHFSFFLKTQTFRYYSIDAHFDVPLNTPSHIMDTVQKIIHKIYRADSDYRATGIVLHAISSADVEQADLFGGKAATDNRKIIYKQIDKLFGKYGFMPVFLASSLQSRLRDKKKNTDQESLEAVFLRMGIPSWGKAD